MTLVKSKLSTTVCPDFRETFVWEWLLCSNQASSEAACWSFRIDQPATLLADTPDV